MTGLDTSVLVRYIMQDDARQSPLATRLIESLTADSPGFIPLVSVVEIAWVLLSAYELDKRQLVEVFEALLRTKELIVESAEVVWKALRLLQGTDASFADCLVSCSAATAGCADTMTFDGSAANGAGMKLIS